MRNAVCTGAMLLMAVPVALPAAAADLTIGHRAPSQSVPAGQCQGFFGQAITDAMLEDMHQAGCCDVLSRMEDSPAVDALERRLHCDNWHAHRAAYGNVPVAFDDLADSDWRMTNRPVPAPAPGGAAIAPVAPAPAAPAPVAPVEPAPIAAEPVPDLVETPPPPEAPAEPAPVEEPPQEEWIVY